MLEPTGRVPLRVGRAVVERGPRNLALGVELAEGVRIDRVAVIRADLAPGAVGVDHHHAGVVACYELAVSWPLIVRHAWIAGTPVSRC